MDLPTIWSCLWLSNVFLNRRLECLDFPQKLLVRIVAEGVGLLDDLGKMLTVVLIHVRVVFEAEGQIENRDQTWLMIKNRLATNYECRTHLLQTFPNLQTQTMTV